MTVLTNGAQTRLQMPECITCHYHHRFLKWTNSCLQYLKALTLNLQAESKDIIAAVEEVSDVIDTLQDVQDNVNTYHSTWFSTVEVGVLPSLPRRCSHQTQRSNVPADTPSQYYCQVTHYSIT